MKLQEIADAQVSQIISCFERDVNVIMEGSSEPLTEAQLLQKIKQVGLKVKKAYDNAGRKAHIVGQQLLQGALQKIAKKGGEKYIGNIKAYVKKNPVLTGAVIASLTAIAATAGAEDIGNMIQQVFDGNTMSNISTQADLDELGRVRATADLVRDEVSGNSNALNIHSNTDPESQKFLSQHNDRAKELVAKLRSQGVDEETIKQQLAKVAPKVSHANLAKQL